MPRNAKAYSSCTVWNRQHLVQAYLRNRAPEIGLSQRAFERMAQRKAQTQEQIDAWSIRLSR